jgi:hypothetical protein
VIDFRHQTVDLRKKSPADVLVRGAFKFSKKWYSLVTELVHPVPILPFVKGAGSRPRDLNFKSLHARVLSVLPLEKGE